MTGSTPYGLSQENLQKLKSRHQSTLNSIRDLQNFERSMYSKLDTGVANKSLTKPEQEQVIQKSVDQFTFGPRRRLTEFDVSEDPE